MINNVQENSKYDKEICHRLKKLDMKSLLTREEALLFLRNSKSIGEGIDRISNIYSNGTSKGLVITFSFKTYKIGFTHVTVKEGFLQFFYDGMDSKGFPRYHEDEIAFISNKDSSFCANDYWKLKNLADQKDKN